MNKQEPVLLLRRSEFQKVINYLMESPTGALPGSRLVEVLNILDNLQVIPAQAVPMLENALRQLVKSPEPPSTPPEGTSE